MIQTACESCVTTVIEKTAAVYFTTMADWLKQPDQSFQLCSQCSSDHVNHNGRLPLKLTAAKARHDENGPLTIKFFSSNVTDNIRGNTQELNSFWDILTQFCLDF